MFCFTEELTIAGNNIMYFTSEFLERLYRCGGMSHCRITDNSPEMFVCLLMKRN